MNGTTYKRCGCRDAAGKRLGQRCPKLRRGGGWNPNHGVWQYQIDLPAAADGRRRPLRRGTYASQAEAEAVLGQIRDALAAAKDGEPADLTTVGDLIETALKNKQPPPTPAQVRRLLHLGDTTEIPTVQAWLTTWLAGRKKLRTGTRRSYAGHITNHLIPHLGAVRLDKLRVSHLDAMFDAIEERNELIMTMRASREAANRDKVKGMRLVSPATMHRAQRRHPAGLHRHQPGRACRTAPRRATQAAGVDRRTRQGVEAHRRASGSGHGVDPGTDRRVPRPRLRR